MRKTLFSLLALSSLSSYTLAQSSQDEFYEDASRLLYDKKYDAALIQIKNSLQLNPEYVPSLVLSAQVFMATDHPEAAEEALIKARVLGADKRYIDLKLAESYRQQKKYQSIIDELSIRGLPDKDAADLLGYQAEAWISLGDLSQAKAAIDEAQALNPGSLRAGLANVLLAIYQRNHSQAISLGQSLTEQHPNSSEAWNHYASALHSTGQLDKALNTYQQAINLNEKNLDARIARIGILLDTGSAEQTLPDLQYLESHYPYEPRAAYFRSLTYTKLATADNDYAEQAVSQLKLCTEVLGQLPPSKVGADTQLTMVGALAHYGLSEFESSKEYLSLYLTKAPSDLGANRLMGDIFIRLNEPQSAIKFLKVARKNNGNDEQTIRLLATAYSQTGSYEKATELLEELQSAPPSNSGRSDATIDTQLALSLLQSRHTGSGITALKEVFDSDSTQVQAGFALSIALLQNNQHNLALEYAQKLAQQEPDNASFINLLGICQQAVGDLESAHTTFSSLVAKHPSILTAQINLAKIEYDQGFKKEARVRLTKLTEAYPENDLFLLALAKLDYREKNIDSALRLAEKAYQLNPESLDSRKFLIQVYLHKQQFNQAEILALNLVSHSDDKFGSNELLANVYIAIGEPRKAITTYQRMTKDAGFNTESLYRIAQNLMQLKAWDPARHALYKGLESNPAHLPSQLSYIRVQQALGEDKDALERSDRIINEHPKNTLGYLFAGDSLMKMNRFSEAENYYRSGLAQSFNPFLVLGQNQALLAQAKTEESLALIKQYWNESSDQLIGSVYSLQLMEQQNWPAAKTVLETLLETQRDDARNLNNLAYVLDKNGDVNALSFAREAHQLSPDSPFVNDTLGWLLVKSGNPQEGLKHLRQAVVRLSNSPELRYHLGKALLELGRHSEAQRELKWAVDQEQPFEGREDAINLLDNKS